MKASVFCTILFSVLVTCKGLGQTTFLVSPSDTAYVSDTVTPNYTVEKIIAIQNNCANSYTLDWEPVGNTGPRTWQYAICDIQNCYEFSYRMRSFYFASGDTGTMKLSLSPVCTPGAGQLQVRLWVDGDSAATQQVLTWVISVDTANACLASGINKLNENADIHIFPNPALSQLEVSFSQLEESTCIELYDISGRLMYKLNEVGITNNIPFQSLATGTYILKVLSPSGVVTKKVEKI